MNTTPKEVIVEALAFLKEKIQKHPVELRVTYFLPRVEKIYKKRKSMLANQAQNVLLNIINKPETPITTKSLVQARTVHFVYGTLQEEYYMFVSQSLYQEMKKRHESIP